jgi:hypothetical protein
VTDTDTHTPEPCQSMNPCQCPRWEKCEAPLCPLDTRTGSHLPGESVCWYLRAGMYGHVDAVVGHLTEPVRLQLLGQETVTHPRLLLGLGRCATGDLRGKLKACKDPVEIAARLQQRRIPRKAVVAP